MKIIFTDISSFIKEETGYKSEIKVKLILNILILTCLVICDIFITKKNSNLLDNFFVNYLTKELTISQ